MFKKATFAFAGVLGMVAVAALSTTAGAADTDAALSPNDVTFYENQNFNLPLGVGGKETVTATLNNCQAFAGQLATTGAQSAQLLDSSHKVELFSNATCTSAVVATLDSVNQNDPGTTWSATVKSYKRIL